MPEAPDPQVPPERPATEEAAQPQPKAEAGSFVPMRSPLSNGQRWQSYQIGEQLDTDTGWLFQAVNAGTLEEVLIRVFPSEPPGGVREQTWNELRSLDRRDLIRGVEVIDEDGFRFEVWLPEPDTTLRDWAAARQASLEDVQILVQQIGDALISLHDRGIVHLNLRPDTVYLPSEDDGLKIAVGGFEHATLYNQPELVPIPVDPLYAPPEAAGLAKHSPGAGLRAWDWWSLGRILQELVLGKHVLGLVTNREVSRLSAEMKAKAEALLLERDPNSPRAGAVELMPPMNQRLTDLLRGLLTSSRDGRWGADEVQRWLKQQPVKDRYQLARNEQLFTWKDRGFTVSEAAEYFAQEENWADGVTNFFDVDNPTTLVYFVGDRPEYKHVRDEIDALHRFMQIPNWAELPVEARQTAVLAVGLMLLGGDDTKLLLFGHRIDAASISGLFVRGVAEGVAIVKALTARPYIEMISSHDPDAARLLTTLAETVTGEAVAKAVGQGWFDLSNSTDYARLLLLALEPERKLFDTRSRLLERFACCREEHIQELFSQPKLTRAELVLLASTAAQPERYGYVTHDEWKRSRYEALRKRSAALAAAVFWLRLGSALRAGYVLFGPIYAAAGIWVAAGLAAGWSHGLSNLYLWAGAALGLFLGLRLLGCIWIDVMVRHHAAGARPWTLFTSRKRCAAEAGAVIASDGTLQSSRALSGELAGLQAEVQQLHLDPAPAPLPRPGFALPAWNFSFMAWLILVAGMVAGHWRVEMGELRPVDHRSATARAIEDAMKPGPSDMKPTAEDYFFDDPKKPRATWSLSKPHLAPEASIAEVKPATSDDVAQALIDGQRLLMSYRHASVDALIAVPVEGKNGTGLLLYDGHNRRVIQRQLLVPAQLPADRTWFDVDSIKVYYAGRPPATQVQPKSPAETQKANDTSDLPEREIHRGAYQEPSAGAYEKTTKAQPLPEALDTMLAP